MRVLVVCGLGMLGSFSRAGDDPPLARPAIRVTTADRAAILKKIETQPWAKAQFDALVERTEERLSHYQADPDAYALMPAPERLVVRDDALRLRFDGRYAVVETDDKGEARAIYVGEGTMLRFRDIVLRRRDGKGFSAHAEKTVDRWRVTSPGAEAFSLTNAAESR